MANAKGLDLLHKQQEFSGCKIALICDDKLPTILRDDKASIPYPNMWELPGGGRWKECQGKSDIVLHYKNSLSRLFFFNFVPKELILSQKYSIICVRRNES